MGCLYRRKRKRKDGTVLVLPTWWMKYYEGGRAVRESTGTDKETVARRILRTREGDVERGIPIVPQMGKVTFEEAVTDLQNDYDVNRKRTAASAKRRIKLHLLPFFRNRRLLAITTAHVREYVAHRQSEGAANATINRELALLKRMFSLAVKDGKLHGKPHIPMLREDNTRRGFFEVEQFETVKAKLPEPLRPVVTFAYLTGWRVKSEILPLEWRQVDWLGRVVRLDPGTTKNREGRTFPFTTGLELLLNQQQEAHERLKKVDGSCHSCSIAREIEFAISALRGRPPATRRDARVGFRTTSGGRRSGTSNATAYRAQRQWRWSVTRRKRSTAATPSSMTACSERRRRRSIELPNP